MTAHKHALSFSRPLLLLCTGILLATLIAASVCQRLITDSLDTRAGQYGNALANLAARQAVDSALNHDLVSLQVILSDVADNPDVTRAVIHDVENNLLVQAGDVQGGRNHLRDFSAAIALHNSVAGHLTVTLDLSGIAAVKQQLYWLFGFMALLLMALTLATLYFGRSWRTALSSIPILQSPPPAAPAPAGYTASPPTPPLLPRVELLLRYHNLSTFMAQLDDRALNTVTRRIEAQIKGVLALYSGRILQFQTSEARIGFFPSSDESPAFQAVCCAQLLLALNGREQKPALQLSALVLRRDSEEGLLRNLQYRLAETEDQQALLDRLEQGTILLDEALADNTLRDKIEFREVDGLPDILRVAGLNSQYRKLLDKQLEQLRRGA